jgi:hypothetical protein
MSNDDEIVNIITRLQKARCSETTSLTEEEVIEERLFHLLKAKEAIEDLVKEIDPNRFAPVRSYSIENQPLDYRRLNLCPICGKTRCTSDHK